MKDGAVDSTSALVPCSNQPESSKSLQLNTSTHSRAYPDPLSAISEKSITFRSRSISASVSLPAPTSLPHSPLAEPRPTHTEPQSCEMRQDSQSLYRFIHGIGLRPGLMWCCIESFVRKLAWLIIDDDPHELNFLGLRLHYQFTSDCVIEQPAPGLPTEPQLDEGILGSTHQPTTEASTVLEMATLSEEPAEEPDDSLSCAQQSHLETDPLLQASPSEDWSNRQIALRRQRLRIERREKTLKTKALQKKCECTEECHCKRQMSETSSIDSTKRVTDKTISGESSCRLQRLPFYQFGDIVGRADTSSESNPSHRGARPDPLTYVGGSYSQRWGLSNSMMSNGSRPDAGQASSNLSSTDSISLHPRRPVPPGRSLSASLLPFSPSSRGYDFGTGEILRSLEFLHHARAVAAGPSLLPWHRNGSFPRAFPHGLAAELFEDSLTPPRPLPGALFTNAVPLPAEQESLLQVDRLRPSTSV